MGNSCRNSDRPDICSDPSRSMNKYWCAHYAATAPAWRRLHLSLQFRLAVPIGNSVPMAVFIAFIPVSKSAPAARRDSHLLPLTAVRPLLSWHLLTLPFRTLRTVLPE